MSSLEQERFEILEAVGAALAAPDCDADRAAACFHLLRHLGSGARAVKQGREAYRQVPDGRMRLGVLPVCYGRHQPPIEARKRE